MWCRSAHDHRDVLVCLVDHARGGRATHDVVEPGLAFDLLHHRGIGHQELVVVILSGGGVPFVSSTPATKPVLIRLCQIRRFVRVSHVI
jgi:hypothetical protein